MSDTENQKKKDLDEFQKHILESFYAWAEEEHGPLYELNAPFVEALEQSFIKGATVGALFGIERLSQEVLKGK